MSVVARAMRTIMAKTVGLMTPKSSPTVRTISSIRPRVFISQPTASDSRQPWPVSRAATAVPPTFPTVATSTTAPHHSQSAALSTSPMRVFMPVAAKKAGRSSTVTGSRSIRSNSRASRPSCGRMAPNRKAPNRAWMPITSVARADSSTPRKTSDTAPAGSGPAPSSNRRASRRASGRTTRSMTATKTSAPPTTRTADPTSARATPTTPASRHQAITSPAAAAAKASRPTSVQSRPRSPRMRASTGKAVTAIATPRNRAKVSGVAPAVP